MSVSRHPPTQAELNPRNRSTSPPYRTPSTAYAPLPAIGPTGAATGREMVPYSTSAGASRPLVSFFDSRHTVL